MTQPTKPDQQTASELRILAGYTEAKQYFGRICARLTTMGVTAVRIEYNGYGDSGAIDSVIATKEGGETVTLTNKLSDRLADAAEDLLPSGFEIDDGSFGALVLDVKGRKLSWDHQWRYTTTEYEGDEWEL